MGKRIFIDCGTHMFQGFKEFSQSHGIDDSWECYSFEANPITYERSRDTYNQLIKDGYKIQHRNVAVSSYNGNIRINCEGTDANWELGWGQGSNTLENPPSVDKLWGHKLTYLSTDTSVECIDFAQFVKDLCSEEDYVLVKIDIEGSEFDVLDHLLDSADVSVITELYVEFHERFFEDLEAYRIKKESYKSSFEDRNVKFNEWK